jgi:sporulation protein YunB
LAKFRGIRPPKPKKRKGPLPFQYVFLLSFVLFMFSTAFGLIIVNKGIEPALRDYAEFETERVATLAINKAINQKVAEGIDVKDLVILEKNNEGEITLVNTNTALVNRVQSEMVNLAQKNLKLAEQGKLRELEVLTDIEIEESEEGLPDGVIRELPLGLATNMAILGNLGPKIPVKFTTVGEVKANVVDEIKEFGINNFQILVSVHVEVNVQVIIPFATKIAKVENTIPIGNIVLPGEVPQFYNGSGGGVNPSIEISPN